MDKIIEISRRKRFPLTATIETTYKCNFVCKYCFQNSLRKFSNNTELNVNEWKILIKELSFYGCLRLVLTGGELSIKNGISEIYKYAYDLGFILDLHSNLFSITNSELFDIIKIYKPNSVVVTIYGNNLVYKNFCGVNDGFNKVKENIIKLKQNGIYVKARSVFNKKNIDSLDLIYDFVQKYKIPIDIYSYIMTDCDLIHKHDDLNISENETINVYKKFNKCTEIKNMLQYNFKKDTSYNYCSAGINSLYINPYGEAFLCPTLLNISKKFKLENDFKDVWNKLYLERKKYIEKETPCSICQNKKFCGVCNATYIKEYNSNRENLLKKCNRTNFIKNLIK